ncbi:g11897 [Coccomyxa elongata]
MFKSILHDHNGRKAELRRQGEKTRSAAIKSADALASTLVEAVDSEVSQAFELEKQLSKEAKEARALAIKFKDQTSGWIAAACRADAVLREFGDAEQYLRSAAARELAPHSPSLDSGSVLRPDSCSR